MPNTVDVIVDIHGSASGKMRNDLVVDFAAPAEGGRWELATDEGAFHGGDNTAPPPLALFAASLVACIMTQIRAFSARMDVPIRDLSVTARATWLCHLDGRKPYTSEPNGFQFDIDVDSDAPRERVIELVTAARKGCFLDQTLIRENNLVHRLRDGDEYITIDA